MDELTKLRQTKQEVREWLTDLRDEIGSMLAPKDTEPQETNPQGLTPMQEQVLSDHKAGVPLQITAGKLECSINAIKVVRYRLKQKGLLT